jgi:hypothetical protein
MQEPSKEIRNSRATLRQSEALASRRRARGNERRKSRLRPTKRARRNVKLTPAQWRAEQQTARAETAATRRTFCNFLTFWIACPLPACKRARACVGDAYSCMERWWPIVPEHLKAYFQVAIKARADGLNVADAHSAGLAAAGPWPAAPARK